MTVPLSRPALPNPRFSRRHHLTRSFRLRPTPLPGHPVSAFRGLFPARGNNASGYCRSVLNLPPPPNPSPQGGGGFRCASADANHERWRLAKFPSPLWGGVGVGGTEMPLPPQTRIFLNL